MDVLLSMKANISEEEKNAIINNMMHSGSSEDMQKLIEESEKALFELSREAKIKEEMYTYIENCIRKEFNLTDKEDVTLKWEEYKEKHGIVIKEDKT